MDMQNSVEGKSVVPKVIAFYLPQYHEIPENNKWWGKGFTEWTNVKRAKKIFDGQYQPHVPLNNNYYDLLDRKTVEWQNDLANKYGLYGFCYFHYYFRGKKLLEKPAENLLKWKDIPQEFCFAWANDTWARTWDAVKGGATSWSLEDERNGEDKKILIQQTYGEQNDWEEHIMYLLPFFHDSRYIKKDGKPMFLIYKLNQIPNAVKMFALWNEVVKKHGFPGIHIVSMDQKPSNNPYVEAIAHYAFNIGLSQSVSAILYRIKRRIINSIMSALSSDYREPKIWDYEFVWKAVVNAQPYGKVQNYLGAFVNYDDTPRHGINGTYLKNSSPDIFKKYLTEQLIRAKGFHSEYIFLDAWNEWGEGNYLEPNQKDGYAYLQALSDAVSDVQEL